MLSVETDSQMCETVNKNLSAEVEIGFHLFFFFIFLTDGFIQTLWFSESSAAVKCESFFFFSTPLPIWVASSPEQKLHLTPPPVLYFLLVCLPLDIQGPVNLEA